MIHTITATVPGFTAPAIIAISKKRVIAATADPECQGGNAATAIERVAKVGLIATAANGGAVIGKGTY